MAKYKCNLGYEHAHPYRGEGVRRGAEHGAAKLTEEDVREILRRAKSEANPDGELHTVLAREKGVSQASITRIVQRKNWKHVEP